MLSISHAPVGQEARQLLRADTADTRFSKVNAFAPPQARFWAKEEAQKRRHPLYVLNEQCLSSADLIAREVRL